MTLQLKKPYVIAERGLMKHLILVLILVSTGSFAEGAFDELAARYPNANTDTVKAFCARKGMKRKCKNDVFLKELFEYLESIAPTYDVSGGSDNNNSWGRNFAFGLAAGQALTEMPEAPAPLPIMFGERCETYTVDGNNVRVCKPRLPR